MEIKGNSKIPKMGKRVLSNTKSMLNYCKADSFVVFDRESTHFQPHEHYGKIIELSALKIRDGVIVDSFDKLVNPEIKISKKIVELTGITNEMVEGAPGYKEVIQEFLSFCEGSVIVAHNAYTDINYVNYFSSKMGLPFDPPYIDTMNLCKYLDQKNRKSVGPKSYGLAAITQRYGIEMQNHHRAMDDTAATTELFLKLKQLLHEDILQTKDGTILPEVENVKDSVICDVKYWEKDLGHKFYRRIYVRLALGDKTNNVYYDFSDKAWGVKDAQFKMPGHNQMTDKLKDFMHVGKEANVYQIDMYKKG